MATKTTNFNFMWLQKDKYTQWLQKAKTEKQAYCKLCKKTISLSSMGEGALKSHLKSSKHRAIENCIRLSSMKNYVNISSPSVPDTNDNNPTVLDTITSTNLNEQKMLADYMLPEKVVHAEIIWCLNMAEKHSSYRTAENGASLFPLMFPDSHIASKIQLKKDKINYLTLFGISPFFQDELRKEIQNLPFFVVLFDESLNKISQKGQMDVHVRYWRDSKVVNRYLTSGFLGHATSAELLKCFLKCLEGYNLRKIIHVSMDGPNVNWKFFKLLRENLKQNPDFPEPISFGSCALHVVHGAFRYANNKIDWKLNQFLNALYTLFKDSPARRADMQYYNGGKTTFPIKFCSVRWVENSKVAEKAAGMIDQIMKYVDGVQSDKLHIPTCNSFKIVKEAIKDPLLGAKLAFFQTIATELERFLVCYQTDQPMVPFMHDDLFGLFQSLMNRFVKKSIMTEQTSAKDIINLELSCCSNLIKAEGIDIGFSTRQAIRKSNVKTCLPDVSILKFRNDCLSFMVILTKKLQERSPLKYPIVTGFSCLSPKTDKSKAAIRMKTVLENWVESRQLSGIKADRLLQEFKEFLLSDLVTTARSAYVRNEDRLDQFYYTLLAREKSSTDLISLIRQILILSHGQASVERGFSVNRHILVENLHEESLIAQRTIYDKIIDVGGIGNISISKGLIMSANKSSFRRRMWLQDRRKVSEAYDKQVGEEILKKIQIKELFEKKRQLELQKQKQLSDIEEEIRKLKK